jgi:hypothetical protein
MQTCNNPAGCAQVSKPLYAVSGGKSMAVENVLRHIYEAYEVRTHACIYSFFIITTSNFLVCLNITIAHRHKQEYFSEDCHVQILRESSCHVYKRANMKMHEHWNVNYSFIHVTPFCTQIKILADIKDDAANRPRCITRYKHGAK